jgi:hypothetical protein
MSNEIYKETKQILGRNPTSYRHTFFQLKHFVLGKELTTQSKMQKCLKEMESRFDSITNMDLSIEDIKDDIKLIELKIQDVENKKSKAEIGEQYKEIEIRKLNRKKTGLLNTLENLIKKKNEAEEEMEFFVSAFKQLEKIEPLKKHDDLESNSQFWNENLSQELQLRLLLQKPLDLELVKCILALNKDAPIRNEMINILNEIQNKALQNRNEKIKHIQE